MVVGILLFSCYCRQFHDGKCVLNAYELSCCKEDFFFFCSVRNQISDDSSAFKGGVFEYVCDYSF